MTNLIYLKVSDSEAVAQLDQALKPMEEFDKKLFELVGKYKADTPYVFDSLDRGLEFSCFWYRDFPSHLDLNKEFKLSTEKNKPGYEVRPRRTNKKFYAAFFEDLKAVNYNALTTALYGDNNIRTEICFKKVGDSYFLTSLANVILPHEGLTATQYKNAIEGN